jgi:hypothetical protein
LQLFATRTLRGRNPKAMHIEAHLFHSFSRFLRRQARKGEKQV